MVNDVMVTGAFAGKTMAAGFAGLNPQEESLSDGIGASVPVLGYRGKVWSLRYRGEEHTLVRPDDGSPISYVDVIILRQARVKSKTFYQDGYELGNSAGKRPTCASIDGVRPDPGVDVPQAATCALCSHNEFKMQQNGKRGKECSDYKRLAVLMMPNVTTALLGEALMEPVLLRVPPGSLQNLAVLGDTMSNQGFHYASFLTRISFDTQEAHPKFVYRAIQALSDAEAEIVLPLRETAEAKRATGEDQIGRPAPVAIAPPPANAGINTGLVQAVATIGGAFQQGAEHGGAPRQAQGGQGQLQGNQQVLDLQATPQAGAGSGAAARVAVQQNVRQPPAAPVAVAGTPMPGNMFDPDPVSGIPQALIRTAVPTAGAAVAQQGTGLVQAQTLTAPAPTQQPQYEDAPDADLDAKLASLLNAR